MLEHTKSFRINTDVGKDKEVHVNLDQDYDILEILSLKITQSNSYKYNSNNYGVIVGRVLANNGFGVPNAKIGIFIPKNDSDDIVKGILYPYIYTSTKNMEGVKFNLLPSSKVNKCHQAVGTFPEKRMVLDNNSVLEVFDEYYKYTTRTNDSGDYMIFGVPVGSYTLHMDLDISDCGVLSQRPRDFVYKGYTVEQFENPNQFKMDTELGSLSQIFSQDMTVNVIPFWGDDSKANEIGISRADMNVQFKFEPTCVFMGSIVSDMESEGFSPKCVPTNRMGEMEKLVTGEGTIEMIRKKIDGTIEELQIKGKQLINGNGVWCYQIPMNLDYMTTDEYGNMVPTDNPERGIPTRADIRFRISMVEPNENMPSYFRGKVLVPNNPSDSSGIDYSFGSSTKDESFKTLFWNNVYSVKSFVPRIQKSAKYDTERFTGIKHVNKNGSNNPIPYNNIRIKLPFNFWITCNIVKLVIRIISVINVIKGALTMLIGKLGYNSPYTYVSEEICPDLENWFFIPGASSKKGGKKGRWWNRIAGQTIVSIANEIGDTTSYDEGSAGALDANETDDYVPFSVMDKVVKTYDDCNEMVSDCNNGIFNDGDYLLLEKAGKIGYTAYYSGYYKVAKGDLIYEYGYSLGSSASDSVQKDRQSIDYTNNFSKNNAESGFFFVTRDISYLMQCVEMNLAKEYEIIKFDFYNDWLNGTIYLPRWARQVKRVRKTKRRQNSGKYNEIDNRSMEKVSGCMNNTSIFNNSRRYFQQCAVAYSESDMSTIVSDVGCSKKGNYCWKQAGVSSVDIAGKNGGFVDEETTLAGHKVYYMKPCEWILVKNKYKKVNLFATDIILLGSLADCNADGLQSIFNYLQSTTYQMPTNLALTNSDEEGYIYHGDGQISIKDVLNSQNWKENFQNDNKKPWSNLFSSGVTASQATPEMIKEVMEKVYKLDPEDMGNVKSLSYDDRNIVTEMSGIEWGYTGPLQNKPTSDKLYSPGGHFLGLSCGNAETNIKSCVNLQRACEAGVTLSQRLEIPIGFSNSSDGSSSDAVNFLYITPNGLISRDQINDVNFRSIFATLNHNNLSTKFLDNGNGYKRYDFKYLIPDNFDGSLRDVILNRCNSSYNSNISAKDAIDGIPGFPDVPNVSVEKGSTISRLIEERSNDYFNFRMGDNPTFLYEGRKNGARFYALPSYQNSFYFYFGLINGSTAVDEFTRQFYGSCVKSDSLDVVPYIMLDEGEFTPKDGAFYKSINVTVKNSMPSYQVELYEGKMYYKEDLAESKPIREPFVSFSNSFKIEYVHYGDYTVVVKDNKGSVMINTITIGSSDFDCGEIIFHDYKRNLTSDIDFSNIDINYYGGYIEGLKYPPRTDIIAYRGEIIEPYYYITTVVNNKEYNIYSNGEASTVPWTKQFIGGNFVLLGPGYYKVYVCFKHKKETFYELIAEHDVTVSSKALDFSINGLGYSSLKNISPYVFDSVFKKDDYSSISEKERYTMYKRFVVDDVFDFAEIDKANNDGSLDWETKYGSAQSYDSPSVTKVNIKKEGAGQLKKDIISGSGEKIVDGKVVLDGKNTINSDGYSILQNIPELENEYATYTPNIYDLSLRKTVCKRLKHDFGYSVYGDDSFGTNYYNVKLVYEGKTAEEDIFTIVGNFDNLVISKDDYVAFSYSGKFYFGIIDFYNGAYALRTVEDLSDINVTSFDTSIIKMVSFNIMHIPFSCDVEAILHSKNLYALRGYISGGYTSNLGAGKNQKRGFYFMDSYLDMTETPINEGNDYSKASYIEVKPVGNEEGGLIRGLDINHSSEYVVLKETRPDYIADDNERNMTRFDLENTIYNNDGNGFAPLLYSIDYNSTKKKFTSAAKPISSYKDRGKYFIIDKSDTDFVYDFNHEIFKYKGLGEKMIDYNKLVSNPQKFIPLSDDAPTSNFDASTKWVLGTKEIIKGSKRLRLYRAYDI